MALQLSILSSSLHSERASLRFTSAPPFCQQLSYPSSPALTSAFSVYLLAPSWWTIMSPVCWEFAVNISDSRDEPMRAGWVWFVFLYTKNHKDGQKNFYSSYHDPFNHGKQHEMHFLKNVVPFRHFDKQPNRLLWEVFCPWSQPLSARDHITHH